MSVTNKLRGIAPLCFGHQEVAGALGIQPDSARVAACRYAAAGVLLRVRRNLYMRPERWAYRTRRDEFETANLAVTPSYVSLQSALSYWGVSTQIQRDMVESIALRRSVEYEAGGVLLLYRRLRVGLYAGFVREEGVFVARPEKALLDALYLEGLGSYRLDWTALDWDKLNAHRFWQQAALFGAHWKARWRTDERLGFA